MTVDQQKNTALHLAAQYGHQRVVKLLLGSGANTDVTNVVRHTYQHLHIYVHVHANSQLNTLILKVFDSTCSVGIPTFIRDVLGVN